MGVSVSFMSLKRTFFKIKKKLCLAGCKNEYRLSNHRLNTQIAYHEDKFRVFFYWSRDHGLGMMTSSLGSLAYKSWKLTKTKCQILSNYLTITSLATHPKKYVSGPLSLRQKSKTMPMHIFVG